MYEGGATWYADNNINDAREASVNAINSGVANVDTFSWWSDSGAGGTAGIAWVGTLCRQDGYNTNLNERQSTSAGSGFVSITISKII